MRSRGRKTQSLLSNDQVVSYSRFQCFVDDFMIVLRLRLLNLRRLSREKLVDSGVRPSCTYDFAVES
jgi:hypothetical protein